MLKNAIIGITIFAIIAPFPGLAAEIITLGPAATAVSMGRDDRA